MLWLACCGDIYWNKYWKTHGLRTALHGKARRFPFQMRYGAYGGSGLVSHKMAWLFLQYCVAGLPTSLVVILQVALV